MVKNEQKPEYMLPKNDFIFKKLFGSEGNESITKELIEVIIGQKIRKLEFKNPYLLREAKEDKEEILDVKVELTDIFEVDIIELSKADKYFKNNKEKMKEIKNWISFLINPKNIEGANMKEVSEEIQKAYELWQNMNLTEEEREVAERRYLDMVSLEYAKEYEYKQGIAEGKAEKQKEIAKEMLKRKMSIELISEITKLTEEEIKKLK